MAKLEDEESSPSRISEPIMRESTKELIRRKKMSLNPSRTQQNNMKLITVMQEQSFEIEMSRFLLRLFALI